MNERLYFDLKIVIMKVVSFLDCVPVLVLGNINHLLHGAVSQMLIGGNGTYTVNSVMMGQWDPHMPSSRRVMYG
jgi:hypothetical protein